MTELRRRTIASGEKGDQTVEAFVDQVDKDPIIRENVKEEDLISTGCTMLNLACSGFSPYGGFLRGTVAHVIGDSDSGKTLLALSMMGDNVLDPRLEKYDFIYEEPEAAMRFPKTKMFGQNISRVQFIPADKERINPRRVQDWAKTLEENSKKGPFIQVTDSFDSLTSADDLKTKKDDKGKEKESGKGGWKTEKAIVSSETFPKIIGPIKAHNSLYLQINQTRDNIGVTFGEKKTFSGGNAIKFYRTHEIWLATASSITKDVRGKKRIIGSNVVAKIKKNKLTGKIRFVMFPVYDDYGVDDIGSMIDWLVFEGFWVKPQGKQIIETEDDFPDATREKLIRHVEENNLEDKLKNICKECWIELEGEIEIKRKPRY